MIVLSKDTEFRDVLGIEGGSESLGRVANWWYRDLGRRREDRRWICGLRPILRISGESISGSVRLFVVESSSRK